MRECTLCCCSRPVPFIHMGTHSCRAVDRLSMRECTLCCCSRPVPFIHMGTHSCRAVDRLSMRECTLCCCSRPVPFIHMGTHSCRAVDRLSMRECTLCCCSRPVRVTETFAVRDRCALARPRLPRRAFLLCISLRLGGIAANWRSLAPARRQRDAGTSRDDAHQAWVYCRRSACSAQGRTVAGNAY